MPTARQKLNQQYALEIFVCAGLIAAVAQSWTVFWFLVLVLFAGAWDRGDIRLGRRRW